MKCIAEITYYLALLMSDVSVTYNDEKDLLLFWQGRN